MKISYITNSRLPTEKAHGLQTVNMIEAFDKTGAQYELILPRRAEKILKFI